MSDADIPIRAISRALAVLQAINRHGALTITQTAREAQIPYPTACRVIQTLVHEGMIEREEARKYYRATALSQSLSCGYQASSRLIGVARPHIIKLTEETGWPVSLATRVGSSMVIQDSTHALTTRTFSEYYPGFALPISACASGLAYLASCEDDVRANIIEQIAKVVPKQNAGDINLITQSGDDFFASIRERGYAVFIRNQHTKNPGKTSSIAVPILKGGEVVGALALVYFSSALKPNEAVDKYLEPLNGVGLKIGEELLNASAQELDDPGQELLQ